MKATFRDYMRNEIDLTEEEVKNFINNNATILYDHDKEWYAIIHVGNGKSVVIEYDKYAILKETFEMLQEN